MSTEAKPCRKGSQRRRIILFTSGKVRSERLRIDTIIELQVEWGQLQLLLLLDCDLHSELVENRPSFQSLAEDNVLCGETSLSLA